MSIRLIIDDKKNTKKILIKNKITFGRNKEVVDIVLDDPKVSSKHFEIIYDKSSILVRDLSSKNGTFINQKRIENEEPLYVYDILKAGSISISIDAKSLTSSEFERLYRKTDPNYWGENITNILKTSKFVLKDIKKPIKIKR
ncbi:FHA domain protein [Halobacteriovorax sp. BALOs_7]|uniref:FHA domain-containing protein n=1 Tax=Halobacteriovorax sp. BALOs_7 TaxID=2109558 RepID=UPI000EA0EDFE|nr:FHA domain-containing protein [Halobacteriovorax sp. BALOs_7]AYF45958.1 FHA domain protein [Halobacteriovorax sp. BALOs_7]